MTIFYPCLYIVYIKNFLQLRAGRSLSLQGNYFSLAPLPSEFHNNSFIKIGYCAPNFGEVEGAYWFGPVRQSVCPSVRNSLAAEKLKNRLR